MLFALLFALFASHSDASADTGEKSRVQLVDLFIEKATDELGLQEPVKARFANVVRDTHEKRRINGERMDKAIHALANAKTQPAIEKALREYRSALTEQHRIQGVEIDRMRQVLGPKRLAKYLVVKNDLTERIKEILAKPEAPVPDQVPGAAEPAAGNEPTRPREH